MPYLFAAYGIIWLLLFWYLWSLTNRQRRLEEELKLIRQAVVKDA